MQIRLIRSLLLVAAMSFSAASFAQVGPPVTVPPPELPMYDQPVSPGDGYIWTPGYWAWDGDYYWVPGTWVLPPESGDLWTPGYWAWDGNGYLFNDGYWGPTVGFYGGIDYGFGYFGHGYEGGRWQNGHFFYNTAVNHVDERYIHNVYNTRVNDRGNRIGYNGGRGGITMRATQEEEAAARGKRMGPIPAQMQHAYSARNSPQQKFSASHGTPPVTATARPNMAVHPKELPPVERAPVSSSGNAKLDQKNQNEQAKLIAKQNQDRQNLQQKQDREHQQLAKQNAPPARMQQVEQQHQQQTQQMHQGQVQQTRQIQQRQSGGAESHGRGR